MGINTRVLSYMRLINVSPFYPVCFSINKLLRDQLEHSFGCVCERDNSQPFPLVAGFVSKAWNCPVGRTFVLDCMPGAVEIYTTLCARTHIRADRGARIARTILQRASTRAKYGGHFVCYA